MPKTAKETPVNKVDGIAVFSLADSPWFPYGRLLNVMP